MRVVVVGAGIVGAAVTYEVARAGADVVLLDRSVPGSGVTGSSFAWIGRPRAGDEADASTPLRQLVLGAYRRLEREVPGVRVRWHGSLHWGQDDHVRLSPGAGETVLDEAGVRALEPHVLGPPDRALHLRTDGAIDPSAVTDALVRAARGQGARLLVGTTATRLRVDAGRVVGVDTTQGFLPSDTAVVTAGSDVPLLCAPLGVDLPVATSPALLMRFTGPPGLVRTLVATPDLEVRQAGGTLVVAAEHSGETSQAELDRAGRAMLDRLRARFGGAEDVVLHSVELGARPMPADGLPVIGPLDDATGVTGAYVAVMHSGITLAPAAARLIAVEVAGGGAAHELDGLRPGRFGAAPPPGPAAGRVHP